MHRTSMNPVSCTSNLGFDQGQLIEGHRRELVCSGQDAVDADGQAQHPGDMAAQLEMSLDNLDAILTDADMSLANVVRLNVYSTDVGELFKHWVLTPEPLRRLRGPVRHLRPRRDPARRPTAARSAGGHRVRLNLRVHAARR